jgi:flagellar motor switch protein FliN/FliY
VLAPAIPERAIDALDLPGTQRAVAQRRAPHPLTQLAAQDPAQPLVPGQSGTPEVETGKPIKTAKELEAVYDIPVQVSAVLGKATMQVSQLLKLGRGAAVELDRKVGEAIDIYVNNRLVARGEVVVVDERLGVTMTEIVKVDRT